MRNVFTMRGRIGRRQYLVNSMTIVAFTYALVFAFSIAFARGAPGPSLEIAGTAGFLISMVGCAAQAFFAVRRLHDLGKPGSHYWLLFVPLYNIYLGLVLFFTPGAPGVNSYGPAPAGA